MRSETHLWAASTRDEIRALAPRCLTVLPVASTEQHGPHLATVTDTALVDAVLTRALELVEHAAVLRAPTLCYGSSDHHLPFGGTLSLSSATFDAVLRDLVRSIAESGGRRVLLLNGHGGNDSICRTVAADAARQLGIAVSAASYWQLVDSEDDTPFPGHAGAFETSLMLAVSKELVREDEARPSPGERTSPPAGVQVTEPDLWQRIDGFTDDPRRASAAWGREQLERCARAVANAIDALAPERTDA